MRRLSSVTTVWHKRLVPLPVLLAIAMAAYLQVTQPLRGGQAWMPWLLAVAIAVATMLAYRFRLADLADEVFLDDDDLVVHRHGEQARIAVADVAGVEAPRLAHPPRVVVTLRRDSRFGQRIVFMPARPAFAFGRQPVVAALRERIAAARAEPRA